MLRERGLQIVHTLRTAGHEAVFAGGCVRDRLLGIEPLDYDIATSARPEEIEACFATTIPVGRRFGIVIVPLAGHNFEVATFRVDGPYLDGRHPASVEFADARSDAGRRDFTINAMFEDPLTGDVVDYVGGRADLDARVIRAVGDPAKRFAEDRLRMVRAARFAARFGFAVEERTLSAIRAAAPHIVEVSAERLNEELTKILTEGAARRGFELLDEMGLLAPVLPELVALKGCEQTSDFHPEGDVWTHTLCCLEQLRAADSKTLAWGVLLHDVGKPVTAGVRPDGRPTFYGHTRVGAEMAREICRRLRMSNVQAERVAFLVDQHLRHCAAAEMRPATLKRFLRQQGIEELLELTRIDALGSSGDLTHYEYARAKLEEMSLTAEQMRPARLLSGRDLIDIGLVPGPLFTEILAALEEAQLDGRLRSREQALAWVRERYVS